MTLRIRRACLLLGAALAATTSLARAQDAAPKDTVKNFTANVNLGFVNISGNTSLTTLTAGDEITLLDKAWTFKQVLAYVYSKNDSAETANQLAIGLRAERAFGPKWGMYLGVRYYRDPFAGIDRRLGEQVGATYHAIAAPNDLLDLEAGVGLTQERSTSQVENDFPNGRLAARYRHSWQKKTYFQEAIEYLPDLNNSENYRVNSLAELLAPLSESISMRLAYAIAYNNRPEPGFKDSDRTLSVGIQLSF
jgi:putative salt-induced outer membrane protein YdiY